MSENRKPTIAELEKLLDGPEPCIEILPNGELKAKGHLALIESLREKNLALAVRVVDLKHLAELLAFFKFKQLPKGSRVGSKEDIAYEDASQTISFPDNADGILEIHDAKKEEEIWNKAKDKLVPAWFFSKASLEQQRRLFNSLAKAANTEKVLREQKMEIFQKGFKAGLQE